jgi:membrane fusion protein (multidrug efflux system)
MDRRTLALMAVLATAAACSRRNEKVEKPVAVVLPPVKVETAAVEHQRMPRFLTLTGSVLADRQSEVAANVSGRVAATMVERGQAVKAGQVLAIVDSKAAGFSVEAATAQYQAAETQVHLAEQDCQRADTLFSKGSLATAEHERLKSLCTGQLFQANAARANAGLATKLAGDTVIRAPLDGIVGERYVNAGEFVQPSSRVASVYAIDPVRVSISVPEPVVGRVQKGQQLEVQVSAWPERTFPAEVRYVSPALRPNTRDLIVEAVAKNSEGALRPGMFATVRLLIGEEDEPTVPLDAVKEEGQVRRIFLARNGAAFEMVVRTGRKKDGRIAVLEPLGNGDRVIRNPPAGLRDGASIQ